MPPSMPDFDPYHELGVAPDATTEVIEAAWKALLKRHHPDVAVDKVAAEARTKRINQAHDWLVDPVLRERIDAARRRRASTGGRPQPPPRRPSPPPRGSPPRPSPPPPIRPTPPPPIRPTPPAARSMSKRSWLIGAALAGGIALAALRAMSPGVAPATLAGSATSSAGTACDGSYPTICLAIDGPDLDCADIADRRFPVRPPDRYLFDADRDGIGCE